MPLQRPAPNEHSEYFGRYVSLVSESDILSVLERQPEKARAALAPLPEEKASYRYAPGKWSILQVLGHVIDSERVFGYRALCIARGESVALPGFDENSYAANSGHDGCRMPGLLAELEALRRSHVSLLRHLVPAAWSRIGVANGQPVSVRALAYIMAGHLRHHLTVLQTRYGVEMRS